MKSEFYIVFYWKVCYKSLPPVLQYVTSIDLDVGEIGDCSSSTPGSLYILIVRLHFLTRIQFLMYTIKMKCLYTCLYLFRFMWNKKLQAFGIKPMPCLESLSPYYFLQTSSGRKNLHLPFLIMIIIMQKARLNSRRFPSCRNMFHAGLVNLTAR